MTMTITTLWLPVLVSAAFCFIAGAIIWMVMPWHRSDWSRTADEEAVRHALASTDPFKDPAMQQKFIDGPQAYITVLPNGLPQMGGKLLMMFVYNVVVAVLCAYIVSRTLSAGAEYREVFRVAGTVAFIAYGVAYIQESIWFGRRWSLTLKTFVDALIYSLLTGGVFGWLV
jgi:hypothetical protein